MGTGVEEVVAAPIIDAAIGETAAAAAPAVAETAAAEAAAPAVTEAVAPAVPETPPPTVPEAPPPAAPPTTPSTDLGPVPEAAPQPTSVADVLQQTIPQSLTRSYPALNQYAQLAPATVTDASVARDISSQIEDLANLGGTPDQIAAAKDVTEPFNLEDFLNKYGKYGALGGQALLGGLQARGLAKQAGKLRSELGDLPGAKQALATGQEMVAGAKAGQLLPGQDAAVQQFRSDKMAQLESYLQRAGIRDSSSAAALRNQVENQVQNYRQTLLQANLNQGMQLMGVSDAATAAAIKAGYGANADAANLAQRYAAAAAYPLSGVYGPLTPGR